MLNGNHWPGIKPYFSLKRTANWMLQTAKGGYTWNMFQNDMLQEFSFMKKFTAKINRKSKWDLNSYSFTSNVNAIKWYTDEWKAAERIGITIYIIKYISKPWTNIWWKHALLEGASNSILADNIKSKEFVLTMSLHVKILDSTRRYVNYKIYRFNSISTITVKLHLLIQLFPKAYNKCLTKA